MTELEHECCAGCQIFSCGSIRHLTDCLNYPDSMSYMIDQRDQQMTVLAVLNYEHRELIKELETELRDVYEQMDRRDV